MTSTIVPPVDLAPGMPSRVVTISATDVTEGGQSLEGQMVRFALSDTLDVSSGGDVIAKTQAEVVLDANGEGLIRLPVYDENVKSWCGQDWAILVTATWGSQKAIRVPAGTSSIALSALPSVRPLRGREKQWAITGVSLSVTTGPTAGGSVSLSGGVLDFDLVFPPAGPIGDQLNRGILPYGSNLEAFAATENAGTWFLADDAAGKVTGWPNGVELLPSQVTVEATSSTATITVQHLARDFESWTGTALGTSRGWQGWRPNQLSRGILPYGSNLEAFAATENVGTWFLAPDAAGQITGWPNGVELLPAQIVVDATASTASITVQHLAGDFESWTGTSLSTSRSWQGWRRVGAGDHEHLTAPDWSGTATAHAMHGAVYNAGSPTLDSLRSLVRRGLAGEDVHLLCAGDSKTKGSGGGQTGDEAIDSYPARLAAMLGARPGVIYARNTPNSPDRRWTFTGVAGLGISVAPSTTTATVRIDVDEPHTGFTFVLQSSTAGNVSVTVDGGAPQAFSVPGDSTYRAYTVTGLADAAHSVVWDLSGLGTGWRLRSYRPLYSTSGLTITNAGVGGSSAAEWTSAYGGALSYFDTVTSTTEGVAFDAVLLGHGTNDWTNTAALNTCYDDFTGAFGTVLAISPGATPDARESVIAALYGIADRLDLPLVDNRVLLGNNTFAVAHGLADDTVHENARGYSIVAANLAEILTPAGAGATPGLHVAPISTGIYGVGEPNTTPLSTGIYQIGA